MDVAVVGGGAIGSTLAAMLSPVNQVTLVGHDTDHFKRLQNEPLTVRTPDGSEGQQQVTVTTEHEAVAGSDLIVLAVKSYDTATAVADIEPYATDVDVLTVQNGLGNIELMRDRLEPSKVIGGTTTMGAYVPHPGTIRIESFGRTRIGRPWAENGPKLERLREIFENGNFETTIEPAIRQAIWDKVLINVGINPITALTGVRNGTLLQEPGRSVLKRTVEEAQTVAVAEGYEAEEAVDSALSVAQNTAQNRSSMLRDIEMEKQTEIGALNGTIVDLAEEHGLPVPVNRTLAAAVRLRSS